MIPISQNGQRSRVIEHDAFLEEYSVGRIAAPAAIASAGASARHAREARRRLTFAAVLLAPSCLAGSRSRHEAA